MTKKEAHAIDIAHRHQLEKLKAALAEALDWAETGWQEMTDMDECPEYVADMKRLRAMVE